jgi:threonine dehydrogenase-like Zn-dependent dehydrogenase
VGGDGAFAQFISIHATNVFELDEEVPFELRALIELTCVGLHAIDKIRLTIGDTVAIVGCGPLGLIMAILVKHSGAANIFITGLEAVFTKGFNSPN